MTPSQIRTLRYSLDLSQGEFAAKLGVKKNAVSHWERGIKSPSERSVYKLEKLKEARHVSG